jgi:hypothetical protein
MVPFAPQAKTRFTRLPQAPRWWPWVLGVLAAALAGLAVTSAITPEALALIQDRRVVFACWQEQQKKSLTPDAQQFIAVFCEELEKQFREKYGQSL